VTVVDLGSTNGVVVDGERVEQARLRNGSRVVMGSTTLVFHEGRT
jgi:pSer/pThr/pTyr-binding forkhead associated (FHA) protein